jgi:hypothetical protein
MIHNQIMTFSLNVIILLCIMITAECHYLVVYHDHSCHYLKDNDIQLWSWYTARKWHSAVIIIHSQIMTFSCDHDTQPDNYIQLMIYNQIMTFSCYHNTQRDNDILLWSQLNIIIWLCIMITTECHYLVVYHHSWMSLSGCVSSAECHYLDVYHDHSCVSLFVYVSRSDNDIHLWL